MSSPRLLALASALALLSPRLAHAQPSSGAPTAAPAAKTLSPSDLAKAKALFDAGGRAYDAGDFGAAIQAFEQAYAIAPRDGVLFSVAQANRRQHTATGQRVYLDRAITLYKQYLVSVQSGGRRAEATRALGDLEVLAGGKAPEPAAVGPAAVVSVTKKTLLAVDSPTEGVRISIDGSEPKPPQLTAEVTPGRHVVKLTAPGFVDKEVAMFAIAGDLVPASYELVEKPGRLTIEKADGADVSIDGRFVGTTPLSAPLDLPSGAHFVSLTRTGHESWGREVELERGSVHKLDADMPTTTQRRISYGFFAAGGAGIVASAVLFGTAFAKESQAKSTLDKLQTKNITTDERTAYEKSLQDRDNLRTAGGITAASGAALAIVGVLLYAVDSPRSAPIPALTKSKTRPAGSDDKPERPSIELSVLPTLSPENFGATTMLRF